MSSEINLLLGECWVLPRSFHSAMRGMCWNSGFSADPESWARKKYVTDGGSLEGIAVAHASTAVWGCALGRGAGPLLYLVCCDGNAFLSSHCWHCVIAVIEGYSSVIVGLTLLLWNVSTTKNVSSEEGLRGIAIRTLASGWGKSMWMFMGGKRSEFTSSFSSLLYIPSIETDIDGHKYSQYADVIGICNMSTILKHHMRMNNLWLSLIIIIYYYTVIT